MKQTDRALLLRKVNYGESSLVLQLLCQKRGVKSFLFKGAKKKKGMNLMPLSFLEITYYERNETQMGQITAADHVIIWSEAIFDPRKSAALFFMCDVLQSCLKDEALPQESLFIFLSAELLELDKAPFQANYPLYFLMVMTRFLGFEPAINCENPTYFDMHEGVFANEQPKVFQTTISKEDIQEFVHCFLSGKDEILARPYSRAQRQRFLKILLEYYAYHVSGFSNPKSLKILEEVFD